MPVLGIYPEGDIDYLLPTKAPTPTPPPQGTVVDEGGVLDKNTPDAGNIENQKNDNKKSPKSNKETNQ